MSLNLPRLSLHFPSCWPGHVLTRPPLNVQCEGKEEIGEEWPDFLPYPTLSFFPMAQPTVVGGTLSNGGC